MESNILLICLYCGDTMEKPSQSAIERFGDDALVCCNHKMCDLDMSEAYKVLKAIDIVKEKIEIEMLKNL